MKKLSISLILALALWTAYAQQQSDALIVVDRTAAAKPTIAIPEMRGSGAAQPLMAIFNETLRNDIEDSGFFTIRARSMYPLQVPQQPSDFKGPGQSPWLTDWSNPPVNANYLTTGYSAVLNNRLVFYGWLFDVKQADVANAQAFYKLYPGTLDEAGARMLAHQFAADILAKFGVPPLIGSKIYFTSKRTGSREIWVMDHDGANQKQLTSLHSIVMRPAVSPDGAKLAFAAISPRGEWMIHMMSLETGKFLPFFNQRANVNAAPEFTPDGKSLLFASTAGGLQNIYMCDLDGGNLRRVAFTRAIETEPKVNPKTGTDLLVISGRSGPAQLYKMNMDGANASRLTSGEGEAANPAWSPTGQHIAFSWTRGYSPGNFNIFVMDVAKGLPVQLTHDQRTNTYPTWAPNGMHLAYASSRGGSKQIWTMLADGTRSRQLTTQGENENPVWVK